MRHENVRKGGMHAAVHPRQFGERATTGGLCLWQDARFGELFIKVQNNGDDLIDHAVIIDQHFTQRNRLGRLLTASSFNPFLIGLGIDEDTAAFIGPDNVLEVVGSGTVTVVDAGQLTHSSMWDAKPGEALSLIGLRLDVLGEGCRYDLKARIGYPPPEHLTNSFPDDTDS